MKLTSTKRKRSLTPALLMALALALSACSGPSGETPGASSPPTVTAPQLEEDTQFRFTGSSSEFTGGRTFHVTVTGKKDGSLSVTFDEMPMASIGGAWTFVEGKGYKLYIDDGNESLCYSAYDPATQLFSFTYAPSLGEGYGSAPVTFTMADPDFAAAYDGTGLGYAPPAFDGVGYWTPGGKLEATARVTCREDGTCVITGSSTDPREGAWTYDEAANVYRFTFAPQNEWTDREQYRENFGYDQVSMFDLHDDQGGAVEIDEFGLPVYDTAETTYDEATGTYTLEFVRSIRITDFVHFVATYTRLG